MPTIRPKIAGLMGAAIALALGLSACGATPPPVSQTLPSSPPPAGSTTINFFGGSHRISFSIKNLNRQKANGVMAQLATPANDSPNAVFTAHTAAIEAAYQALPQGTQRILTFSNGTTFTIAKGSMAKSLPALRRAVPSGVPTFSQLPQGWRLTEAMSLSSQIDELFQPGSASPTAPLPYEQYSVPSFTPSAGSFIHVHLESAQGLRALSAEGGFSLVQTLATPRGPAVIMEYQSWWTPAPGLTQIEMGLIHHQQHDLLVVTARGLNINQIIGLAESLTWTR
ncbi:MAG: hypothetical protein M1272_04880 [Firmicutes bacterium]|nr:hypothetical protein [Bacillota bacterium]